MYGEEKRLHQEMNSWLHVPIRDTSQGNLGTDAPTRSPIPAPTARPNQHLDQEFETVAYRLRADSRTMPCSKMRLKTYHVLSILRRVSQRTLYIFFGWMNTPPRPGVAQRELSRLISEDKKSAREALLHSAVLFRMIRDQSITTYWDPFWLLIATLYMLAFGQIENNSLQQSVHDYHPSSSIRQPLRIDQDLNDTTQQSWIESDTNVQLHVTGIGLLDGAESGPRILKEAIRILSQRTGWNQLSSGVAHMLRQVLYGAIPNLDGLRPTMREASS